MDELEISGKRYISTRRAAKEYKYHADYIGQLIRGKKLIGRKVGRSWYVELASLTEYFGKEAQLSEPSQLAAGEALREPEPPAVEAENIEEEPPTSQPVESWGSNQNIGVKKEETKINIRTAQEFISEPAVEIQDVPRDEIHIPIRRPSFTPAPKRETVLTYMSDDAPYIPEAGRGLRAAATTSVMPQTEEEAVIVEDEMNIVEAGGVISKVFPAFSIAILGAVVLTVVMFGSIMVNSKMVIEAGKAASIGFTLQ